MIEFHRLPLAPIGARSAKALAELRERIATLPFRLDLERGPAVAGGAVVRALLGVVDDGNDLDVFVPTDRLRLVEGILDNRDDFKAKKIFDGSDMTSGDGRRVWYNLDTGRVDVVECQSIPDALARFDLRICSIATDGERALVDVEAWNDLVARRLVPRRTSTPIRVAKYLDLGLDPVGSKHNADEIRSEWNVPGWTGDEEDDREERLGLRRRPKWRIV